MKKIFISILSFISSSLLMAQALPFVTNYDMTKVASSELNGTARFVCVGGAMGAFGGYARTLFNHPAGM